MPKRHWGTLAVPSNIFTSLSLTHTQPRVHSHTPCSQTQCIVEQLPPTATLPKMHRIPPPRHPQKMQEVTPVPLRPPLPKMYDILHPKYIGYQQSLAPTLPKMHCFTLAPAKNRMHCFSLQYQPQKSDWETLVPLATTIPKMHCCTLAFTPKALGEHQPLEQTLPNI